MRNAIYRIAQALVIIAVAVSLAAASGMVIKRGPVAASFYVTDDFNRADENPLDNGVWTTVTSWNAMRISGQVATYSTNAAHNGSYYSGASFSTNQYSQAGRYGVDGYIGLLCRMSGGDGYGVKIDDSTNFGAIYRFDAGSETILGSTFSHTAGSGETMRLECSGDSIVFKSGGSTIATRTDNTYTSGYPGVYQYNGGADPAKLDDFTGGDL